MQSLYETLKVAREESSDLYWLQGIFVIDLSSFTKSHVFF